MDIDTKEIENILYYIQLYTDCNDYQKSRILQILLTYWKPQQATIDNETIVYQNQKVKYIPVEKIEVYIANFCSTNNITIEFLKTKKRESQFIKIRQIFCVAAYNYGYKLLEISKVLNLHHSTILHYLKLNKNETTNQANIRSSLPINGK